LDSIAAALMDAVIVIKSMANGTTRPLGILADVDFGFSQEIHDWYVGKIFLLSWSATPRYLRILPANCSVEEENRQRTKALATRMVVLREGASKEDREAAEMEAQRAWEESGRTVPGAFRHGVEGDIGITASRFS